MNLYRQCWRGEVRWQTLELTSQAVSLSSKPQTPERHRLKKKVDSSSGTIPEAVL